MRLQPVAVLAALLVLLTAPIARAIPDCENNPDLPICNPDPDPDPCELDPASCEPEPDPEPDPCEVDPASCEPTPEPEPQPEPEPVDYTHAATFEGSLVVKGEGKKLRFVEETPEVLFNAEHFVLIFDKDAAFGGTLVPKGKKGGKFEMIFDDASAEAFAQFVAERMAIVAGRPAQTTIGQSTKMIFALRENGTALLKIKSSVVESDGDEIVLKLKLAGPVSEVQEG